MLKADTKSTNKSKNLVLCLHASQVNIIKYLGLLIAILAKTSLDLGNLRVFVMLPKD